MSVLAFPRMFPLRQKFPPPARVDIRAALARGFAEARPLEGLPTGARVALAVGSRGITNLAAIVATVADLCRAAGVRPFVVPAMGSHGGATAEGQAAILADYGIDEARLGVPVRAAMDARRVGVTGDGVPVWVGAEALRADAVVLVNRVKPHTEFGGEVASGLIKMAAIGLGKREGAAACHAASARLGHERALRGVARAVFRAAPVRGGVAVLEGPRHETARLEVVRADAVEAREPALLAEARRLMPRLPFDDVDLLVVDRLGKDVSGTGMDPNVIGRGVHGYSASLGPEVRERPRVRRLFVRDLTPASHGNASGIGLADFTTARLAGAVDWAATAVNNVVALTPALAKLPMHYATDREAMAAALESLALEDPSRARVLRIADTLTLEGVEASEAYAEEAAGRTDLEALAPPAAMGFDAAGNLVPLNAVAHNS